MEELARTVWKKCIDICAIQETRWCNAKICDIEHERSKNGYKLVYFEGPGTHYGTGITISEGFRDTIKKSRDLMA